MNLEELIILKDKELKETFKKYKQLEKELELLIKIQKELEGK